MDSPSARPSSSPLKSTKTVPARQASQPLPFDSASSRDIGHQRRLLQSRHARFSGIRLSAANLDGSLVDPIQDLDRTSQKNTSPLRSPNNYDLKRNHSSPNLKLLDGTSYKVGPRDARRRLDIPIHQDTIADEFDAQIQSASPTIPGQTLADFASPRNRNSLRLENDKMQLREVSPNERQIPLVGYRNGQQKRKSGPVTHKFDTEDYISHIEKELQLAKDAMYSPTSNKSLKEQLRSARSENGRLRQEITDLRTTFETEVKRTVEHKTAVEVELKRRVRELQDELDLKLLVIRDLECQHEEKRLDSNTIETLKASIDRLEQDKSVIMDENRSISKRNEVLSELLAMSPTKTNSGFELRSPIREKRGGRPMSMIIPRIPPSPTVAAMRSSPASAATSPSLSATCPTSLVPTIASSMIDTVRFDASSDMQVPRDTNSFAEKSHIARPRRLTMQSQCSADSVSVSVQSDLSPTEDSICRPATKRKPRKFMSGSTQLKPLLLPALTGESSQSSSPAFVSPRSSTMYSFPFDAFAAPNGLCYRPTAAGNGFDVDPNSPIDSMHTNIDPIPGTQGQTVDEIFIGDHAKLMQNKTTLPFGHCDSVGIARLPTHLHTSNSSLGCTEPLSSSYQRMMEPRSSIYPAEMFTKTSTNPAVLDLDALRRLRLPEAQYEAYPDQKFDVDQNLRGDIPEPLFSPTGRKCGNMDTSLHNAHHRVQALAAVDFVPNPLKRPFQRSAEDTNWASPYANVNPRRQNDIAPGPFTPVGIRKGATAGLLGYSPTSSALRFNGMKSPLEVLQQRNFGARPLAVLSIRTIFSALSRCTSYMRDLKRDPLGLVRKAIANAWFLNWTRLGQVSWWVLGLFIPTQKPCFDSKWNWEDYDGEEVARQHCEQPLTTPSRYNPLDDLHSARDIDARKHATGPEVEPDSDYGDRQRAGWGSSLLLWGKFSIAVMLAAGAAVVQGSTDAATEGRSRQRTGRNKPRSSKINRCQSEQQRKFSNQTPQRLDPGQYSDDDDSNSRFTFRSLQKIFTGDITREGCDNHEDRTLRPCKSQKRYAADLFQPDDPGGSSHDQGNTSIGLSEESLCWSSNPVLRPPLPGQ